MIYKICPPLYLGAEPCCKLTPVVGVASIIIMAHCSWDSNAGPPVGVLLAGLAWEEEAMVPLHTGYRPRYFNRAWI